MKKRFWTRLISAVVTAAMVFSIMAMPASAASNSWAVGDVEEVPSETGEGEQQEAVMWMSVTAFRDLWCEDPELAAMTDDELLEIAKKMIEYNPTEYFLYEGEVPSEGYFGVSKTADSEIFWYTKEVFDYMLSYEDPTGEGVDKMNLNTGELTVGGKQFSPINSRSGGSSSGDSSAAVILLVGGAAVAAATGVYFYTHPEKVEEIKDFFANLSANVQAKVQEVTANVKGAFQNILPGHEEDETAETAPAAEAAAETPAA